MEDPSGLLHSSIRQSYLHAAVLFSLLAAGCIIVITVIYDGITGTPLPDWVPFDLSGLPYIGALLTFAGLGGFYPLLRARAKNRFLESRLLASWKYTEEQWEQMRLHQTKEEGVGAWPFLLQSLIPVFMSLGLIVIIVVGSPKNGIDPKFYEVVAILILGILLYVVTMRGLLRYGEFTLWHAPRQVLIAPTGILIGKTLQTFDPPGGNSSLVLFRVLLFREGPLFLEFHLATVGGGPVPPSSIKILVPEGEEDTAERVKAFFTRLIPT